MKKMKSALSLSVTFALVLSILTMPAFAAYTPPADWKIYSTMTMAPYDGFSFPFIVNMNQVANQWNSAAGSTLLQISQYTHWYPDGFPNEDGVNYIYSQDAGNDYVALAHVRRKSHLFGKEEVIECDINMNSHHAWSDGAKAGCYDFYSAFLHETGHIVGFEHETMFSESVMYPYVTQGEVKRTLSSGDLTGLEVIYK